MPEYFNRDCSYYLLVLPAEADPADHVKAGIDVIELPTDIQLTDDADLAIIRANIDSADYLFEDIDIDDSDDDDSDDDDSDDDDSDDDDL